MERLTALKCVDQNDICSLRIVCTMARDKKFELEQVDYYGNTALLKACFLGRFEAFITLLQFGADVRAVNHYGQNALTLATCSGNMNIIYELLRICPYEEFNKTTLTPALCVATLKQNWQLVKFFKKLDRYHSDHIQTAHAGRCNVHTGKKILTASFTSFLIHVNTFETTTKLEFLFSD